MLHKSHLTSYSRMSGSSWVTIPSRLFRSLRSFLYSYFVYSFHLVLISSASTRSLTVLSFIVSFYMKFSSGISNFPEEISSISISIVFFYFFVLLIEEGLLVSPCYYQELYIQLYIPFPFSLAFCFSSLFHQLLNPPQKTPLSSCISSYLRCFWSVPSV